MEKNFSFGKDKQFTAQLISKADNSHLKDLIWQAFPEVA